MKSTIVAIGLAIGLSFATVGIADASPASPTTRCSDAKTALMNLQKQADDPNNKAVRPGFLLMIAGLQPQVTRLCG